MTSSTDDNGRASLTVEAVISELVARSLLPPDHSVEMLTGGVSCQVHRVCMAPSDLIVKWGEARLRTVALWESDPSRALREARALTFVHDRLSSVGVPEVVFVVPDMNLFAMKSITAAQANWRASLLAGDIDAGIGEVLGEGVASLHSLNVTEEWTADPGDDVREQLRVVPFYEESARQLPSLRTHFESLTQRMRRAEDRRFVHGDLTPKNVLVGSDGAVHLVDWEVFHLGDPAFDAGMLAAHILCKSVVASDPTERSRLANLVERFWSAYVATEGPASEEAVVGHAAAIALARVHGRSTADYLDDKSRAEVQELSTGLIGRPTGVAELLSAIRKGNVG